MKTNPFATLSAVVMTMGSLAPSPVTAQTIPAIPAGVMSAYPTVVQTGTKPTLTWNILYPSKVSDMVRISPPGTLIPNQTLYVTVKMVGTGVTSGNATQDAITHTSDARLSLNGGNYSQLFYGAPADVDPSKQLYIKKVYANQTIDFGGRYVEGGAWTPFYTTHSSNFQVVALVNGATPPTTFPLYQSPTLASYLKPYLDSTGKVHIGPLSVLILMELGQTNRNVNSFDLQDQVLLVTFSTKHPNNGHGNNLDGVDSSNPGQGHGGPNGLVDPSAGVDDEIR